MMRLAVIILNYRTPELTIDCVDSVAPHLDPARDRAVVVDNCSGDGSLNLLQETIANRGWRDRVIVVEANRNSGFAGGNNVGMQAIDASLYLLLNSDTVVRDGSIAELLRATPAISRRGCFAPRRRGRKRGSSARASSGRAATRK